MHVVGVCKSVGLETAALKQELVEWIQMRDERWKWYTGMVAESLTKFLNKTVSDIEGYC